MKCPHCGTENRDDRDACYHCGKDLSMLRLIANRAKAHYNEAVSLLEKNLLPEALGELQSALNLDSRLAEAHVLKGTLLARLERADDARGAFEAALAINPHALRAHKSLLSEGDLRASLPILRRLRLILAGAGAVAIIGVALTVSSALRPPAVHDDGLRGGWRALAAGRIGESRRIAESAPDPTDAGELLTAINLAVQTRLDAATALTEAGEYEPALKRLAELDAMAPPPDISAATARQRGVIRGRMLARLSAAYGDGDPGKAQLQEAELLEVEFLKIFPEGRPEAEAVVAKFRAGIERAVEALLASGTEEALTRAEQLARSAKDTPLADRIDDRRAELAKARGEQIFSEAFAAAKEGNLPKYEAALASVRALPGVTEDAKTRVESLRTLFVERERAALGEQFAQAIRDGDDSRAVELGEAMLSVASELSGSQQADLDGARKRLALASYYRVMELTREIETVAPDEATAHEILRLVARAEAVPLPARLATKAAENLTFFAAKAHEALGEKEKAAERWEKLRKISPESGYLRS